MALLAPEIVDEALMETDLPVPTFLSENFATGASVMESELTMPTRFKELVPMTASADPSYTLPPTVNDPPMVSCFLLTVSVCCALADRYSEFPPWEAVMVVLPAPTMVTVLPLTVATEELELEKLTDSPEDALADSVNVESPYVLAVSALKETVCDFFVVVKLDSLP